MSRIARKVEHPIICGTDFTEQAAQAANVAAGLAVALRHPLVLVHVTPAGKRRLRAGARGDSTGARDDLRREADRLRALGATVVMELHEGHADEVLTARARDTGATLIVLGALGSRRPVQRFLGSIAERTAETAQVPTLIVRNDAPFKRWFSGKRPLRVLLGFDFTVTAEAAVAWMKALVTAGPCEVTVGHLNWPPDDARRFGIMDRPAASGNAPRLQELLEQQVRERLHATLGDQPVQIRVQPSWGRLDVALVAMAVDARSDLIVVGTHQRHGLARVWSGSVSRGVLSNAPASVVVVPVATVRDRVRPIPTVNRVLVAIDFGAHSHRAVAYGCGVTRPGGVVRVVHVTHPRAIGGGAYETSLGRSDRHLKHMEALGRRLEAFRPASAQAVGVETEAVVVECEDAVKGICQEAQRFDADVIVVGTKGAGVSKAILGSVAEGVLVHAHRPVLVIDPVKE